MKNGVYLDCGLRVASTQAGLYLLPVVAAVQRAFIEYRLRRTDPVPPERVGRRDAVAADGHLTLCGGGGNGD